MATISEFAEGLTILAKYWPKVDVSAQHEVFYAGGDKTKIEMSPEDLARLEVLRWDYDSGFDCWRHFT